MSLSEDLNMHSEGTGGLLPGEIAHHYEPLSPFELVATLQDLNSVVKQLLFQGFEPHKIIEEVNKALNK
jgi:hypothetical protein